MMRFTRYNFRQIFGFIVSLILSVLLLATYAQASPDTQTGAQKSALPLNLNFLGSQSWILKYGLGDPRGLSRKGYSRQLVIEMPLKVMVEGGVPIDWPANGELSISAELDNQRSDNLQSLAINFDSQNFSSMFGKFTVGEKTSFAVYNKKMMGIKATGTLGDNIILTGMLARVEGISETKVFKGKTASDEVIYSFYEEDRPWEEKPYLTNIRGLQFYKLKDTYVQGFTEVKLQFVREGLKKFLTSYELGYLNAVITQEDEKEITESTYEVISYGNNQYLVFRKEIKSLLRGALQEYISEYNLQNELEEEDKKKYPFNRGTDYEEKFLNSLTDYVPLVVNSDSYWITDYQRERFYYLGHKEVELYSLSVEIKTNEDFKSIDEPEFEGYDYQLFPEAGIVEFLFPDNFFDRLEANQIKVTFDYQVTQNVYMLGLSMVKGSEKVYLNEERLQRGQGYSIDYETGILILFVNVGKDDVVRIDYEVARGGLGGYAEYKRNFAGLTVSYKPYENLNFDLELLRAWDQPPPVEEKSSLHTMPNDHFITGLEGKLDWGWFKADLQLGYNRNRFPFDNREKENQVNQINTILPIGRNGTSYVIFGHQNGITVFDGQRWSSFSTGDGLSGRPVYDIVKLADSSIIVFATESGISTLDWKTGETLTESLSKVERWERFYEDDGLPDNTVHTAYIDQGTLWLGTEEGLAQVPLDELNRPTSWINYTKDFYPNMLSNRITELTGLGNYLYLGTEEGLNIFNLNKLSFTIPKELVGISINDLKSEGDLIYVACSQGIVIVTGTKISDWQISETSVNALAKSKQALFYGIDKGLYILGRTDPLIPGWGISALSFGKLAWAGSRGIKSNNNYRLSVWSAKSMGSNLTVYPATKTHIEGKDLYRFQDIPASKHTDKGFISSLIFTQEFDKLTLKEGIQNLGPTFVAIGKHQRKDFIDWFVQADYSFTSDIRLSGKHLQKTEDVHAHSASAPKLVLEDSLKFSWKEGPKVKTGIRWKRLDNDHEMEGLDHQTLILDTSLKETLFDQLISLSLTYQDHLFQNLHRLDSWSRKRELKTQIDLKPRPNLSFWIKYTGPANIKKSGEKENRYGQKSMDLGLKWNQKFKQLVAATHTKYNHRMEWGSLGGRRLKRSDQLEIKLNFNNMSWQDLTIIPDVQLNFEGKAGSGVFKLHWNELKFSGSGNISGQFGFTNFDLTYKKDWNYSRITQVQKFSDQAGLKVRWSQFDNFTPSLRLKMDNNLLTHPYFGERKSGRKLVKFSLDWNPKIPFKNRTSLSLTIEDRPSEHIFTYSISEVVSLDITEVLTSETTLNAKYSTGVDWQEDVDYLQGELSHTLSSTLAKDWQGSITGGYLLGIDYQQPTQNYQSLIAQVKVSTTF